MVSYSAVVCGLFIFLLWEFVTVLRLSVLLVCRVLHLDFHGVMHTYHHHVSWGPVVGTPALTSARDPSPSHFADVRVPPQ